MLGASQGMDKIARGGLAPVLPVGDVRAHMLFFLGVVTVCWTKRMLWSICGM